VSDAIAKDNSAMNILVPTPPSQQITKSRRIGFLIYPDCEICDVCGPLDVFHFANFSLPRFGRTNEPGYQLVPGCHVWTGPDALRNRDHRDPELA
jgi:hypothetical protein